MPRFARGPDKIFREDGDFLPLRDSRSPSLKTELERRFKNQRRCWWDGCKTILRSGKPNIENELVVGFISSNVVRGNVALCSLHEDMIRDILSGASQEVRLFKTFDGDKKPVSEVLYMDKSLLPGFLRQNIKKPTGNNGK